MVLVGVVDAMCGDIMVCRYVVYLPYSVPCSGEWGGEYDKVFVIICCCSCLVSSLNGKKNLGFLSLFSY